MNRQEHLLSIVAEECAEVAQRASKALRFGLYETQPDQALNNWERIMYEFADLCAALELTRPDSTIDELVDSLRPAINAKRAKVEKFLAYSATCGTLTKEPKGEEAGT